MISLIAAIDLNNGIGKDNQLLFHIKEDLQRFKQLTINHTIVMGRKTFDSLPNGALPNRRNIVLSKLNIQYDNVEIVNNIETILELSKSEDIFIIGGGEIYKQFINYADKLYITRICESKPSDTHFPIIDINKWKIEKIFYSEMYDFIDYIKK